MVRQRAYIRFETLWPAGRPDKRPILCSAPCWEGGNPRGRGRHPVPGEFPWAFQKTVPGFHAGPWDLPPPFRFCRCRWIASIRGSLPINRASRDPRLTALAGLDWANLGA